MCEYHAPEREPATVEGWACWSACEASLRGGMVQPHVDIGAALTVTAAMGVAPFVAADLLMAAQHGLAAGLGKKGDAS
jgi:hypothetical protein